MQEALQYKTKQLEENLKSLGDAVVAFSGGVDSSMLAAAAYRVLGSRAIAITAVSETMPASERREAEEIAGLIGIKHFFVAASELDSPEFTANDARRCYYCKKTRYSALLEWVVDNGYTWLIEGSNVDDLGDYRPGLQALRELERVKTPLLDAGFSKEEIRRVSRQWGLPTWEKPGAACLASRVAYGLEVTPARLRQIEKAEEYLQTVCPQPIRVRHHGEIARIEVAPQYLSLVIKEAANIDRVLKSLGFTYIALDLQGYQTGSMNLGIL